MRFSIRDLLWLTVVVALALGWGVDRWTWPAWRSRAYYWSGAADVAKDSLTKHGHSVKFVEGLWVEIDGQITLIGSDTIPAR